MFRGLVTLIAPVVLAALIFLGNLNPVLGALAIAACAGLLLLLALGLERAGVASVVIAMFFAPMDGLRAGPLTVVTISDLFLVVGMLLLVPTMVDRHVRLPTGYTVGAYILIAAGLLASALGPEAQSSVLIMMRLVVAAVLLPVFFAWWRPELRIVDLLAGGYVVGQVVSSLAAFVLGPEVNNRYKGLSSHVNYFGLSALLSIALAMYLFHRLGKSARVWLILAAALFTVSILFSGSRAAVLVGILLLVIYPAVERNALTTIWVLLGGALSVPIAEYFLRNVSDESPLSRLLGDRSTGYSDDTRSDHLQEGVDRFLDKPLLGDGFSNAPLEAHNIYLQVLVVVGLVGFVGYLLIFYSLLRPLLNRAHPLRRLGYAVFAYAAIGMLTNSLWDRFNWIVLALAFLGNLDYSDEEPEEPDQAPDKTPDKVRRGSRALTQGT